VPQVLGWCGILLLVYRWRGSPLRRCSSHLPPWGSFLPPFSFFLSLSLIFLQPSSPDLSRTLKFHSSFDHKTWVTMRLTSNITLVQWAVHEMEHHHDGRHAETSLTGHERTARAHLRYRVSHLRPRLQRGMDENAPCRSGARASCRSRPCPITSVPRGRG
jgi:hypothetical protein